MSPLARHGCALAIAALLSSVAAGCEARDPEPQTSTVAASGPAIDVSAATCAAHWQAPPAGPVSFSVDNVGTEALRVELVSGIQDGVYGEIYSLAPGVSNELTTVLPHGVYQWRCLTFGHKTLSFSPERSVTGHTTATPHILYPLTSDEEEAEVLGYQVQVEAGLKVLGGATTRLAKAVVAGNLPEARRLWLAAHLDYSRLGAAYDTFGRFADLIDGRADGLPGGVHSSQFSGFLRLEYGLWHGQSHRVLARVARQLSNNVHALAKAFPQQSLRANELALRAHEILENTLEFELTGDTDEGSHTNLATAWANVQGTEGVLEALQPALQARAPKVLSTAHHQLAMLATRLVSFRHVDGTWTPLDSLTIAEREGIDSLIGAALENLSRIPDILQSDGER